jgi:hypothetical protein
MLRNLELLGLDLLVKHSRILILEWKEPAKHRIKNDPATPHIALHPFVRSTHFASIKIKSQHTKHFRSCVTRRPAGRPEESVFLNEVAETEIRDFDIVLLIQQQIFRLNISISLARPVGLKYLCG